MLRKQIAGIEVNKLIIPALNVIFSILALGYLSLSSLVLFVFLLGGHLYEALAEDHWLYLLFFTTITFLSIRVVIALPLNLKQAVSFTHLLLIAIIIMLVISNEIGLPLSGGNILPKLRRLNVLTSGISFGFIIGISAKILVYGVLHSLVVRSHIPPVSRQTMATAILVGILIGVITTIQISLLQIHGFILNYGFLTGCIGFMALILSTKETGEVNLADS